MYTTHFSMAASRHDRPKNLKGIGTNYLRFHNRYKNVSIIRNSSTGISHTLKHPEIMNVSKTETMDQ